jgi:lipopolysaccharide export system permease protein
MLKKILSLIGIKTIDLYIIKKFLGTFFFSIALILSIVIVFDLAEKMEDFLENNVGIEEIIFTYYLNFLPYFANLFSPLFIFISVIFFTSKLTSNSEIVAILSSGVSYQRLMRPYFYSALVLAILSFFLTGYIIPPANKHRIDFELKYIDGAKGFTKRNVHKQVAPGLYAYMESYDNNRDVGYKFSLEKFKGEELISKMMATRVNWDSTVQKWQVQNYYIRNYDKSGKQEIIEGKRLDTTLNMSPKDFKMRLKSIETLNTPKLEEFIAEQQMKGDDNIEAYKVERYRRLAFPFSTFILTLIGVSLSTRKKRGGTGLNIAAGIALSFIYILFMQVFNELAKANTIPSLLAVWTPNIIFFAIGIFLYRLAPK